MCGSAMKHDWNTRSTRILTLGLENASCSKKKPRGELTLRVDLKNTATAFRIFTRQKSWLWSYPTTDPSRVLNLGTGGGVC